MIDHSICCCSYTYSKLQNKHIILRIFFKRFSLFMCVYVCLCVVYMNHVCRTWESQQGGSDLLQQIYLQVVVNRHVGARI